MLFKNRLFWIILVGLALVGSIYATKFFPEAFPILSVDLKMDRSEAVKAARDIAVRDHFGPAGYRETAIFDGDSDVQDYVELEGGGKDAFRAMISGNLYAPYQWIVRHYREGEKNEAKIYFTPQGVPYGFSETIPENQPGAALTSDAALAIAQKIAADEWAVQFADYNPPERSQEVKPGGRIDHTFVFERPQHIGEGRYQLTLVVSGDRLTELTRSVKVPEAFTRRYAQMRSVNDSIYMASWSTAAVLYIIGGCFIGLFFLLRQRWVLWRGALVAGVFVALMQALASLNGLSLQWMEYNTALSLHSFMLTSIVVPLLTQFLEDTLLFSLSFIAAESLTRRAFPHHIQIWKLWRPEAAASPELLGRTLAGYLVVGIDMAYLVAFYIITDRHFGWWSPSEALIDPNLPANTLPWFTPIAQAMQAGTWEESMFRAIPLAGAALIGDALERRGRKNARIVMLCIAFVVQFLVFGAGHATYPVQPAYGRMIELIVPSIIFATLYLRFGLLPAIIAHFFFDVVMMSLPILVSSLPGVWFDRAGVFLFTLIPLWIVLGARLRRKAAPLPPELRNAAWQPAPPGAAAVETVLETAAPLQEKTVVSWLLVGLVGLALWIGFIDFRNFAPPLNLTRAQAVTCAQLALQQHQVTLDPSWTILSSAEVPRGEDDSFVWRNGTPEQYRLLMNRFLQPPFWQVRFVRFTGDVARRAEEYRVDVTRNGEILEFAHQLPEAAPGASLTAAQAQAKAAEVLRTQFGADPATLRSIASEPTQQPNRVDWTLLYEDPARYPLKAGEGRYAVYLGGDEVIAAQPLVFIPDAWKRKEMERSAPLEAFSTLTRYILLAAMVAALATALVAWSARRFSAPTFVLFFVGVVGLRVAQLANAWPSIVAGFSTSKSVLSQTFSAAGGQLIHAIFGALSIAAAAGYFQGLRRHRIAPHSPLPALLVGTGLALAWVGVRAATSALVSFDPPWASYIELGATFPWLSGGIARLVDILYTTAEFFWLLRLADVIVGKGGPWLKTVAAPALLIVVGTTLYLGGADIDTLGSWLLTGAASGLVVAVGYFTFLRLHRAWLPFAFGLIGAFGALKQGFLAAYPGAWGNYLGATLLILIGWLWTQRLIADEPE